MLLTIHILIAVLFVGPAVVIPAYYLVLLILRLLGADACVKLDGKSDSVHSFAIVIPAHNEQEVISLALLSCDRLNYPNELFQVFVIADNCSDATASVAAEFGATCLERNELQRPGKGPALQWGFNELLKYPFDAFVVLDADCEIDPDALAVFDQCLVEGSNVLQSNHLSTNCDESPSSYVARVGQFLEYDLAYAPKSDLNMAVPLVGTGMVFHRDIITQHPWTANSVVEDIEYSVQLIHAGVQVRFVSNVAVRHLSEKRIEQLQAQRRRWASGTLRLTRTKGLKLLLKGLIHGKPMLADFGWTLLTMSRPLILLHLMMTLVITSITAFILPNGLSFSVLFLAGVALMEQTFYYTLGIVLLGVTRNRLLLLAQTPCVLCHLAWISFTSLFASHALKWERTPR